MAKAYDSYIVTFRWNLNDIIYNCKAILEDMEKFSPRFDWEYLSLKEAMETLKSPRTTKEKVYKTLRKLVQTWEIFGEDTDEMKKAYKEEKEVFVIISSGDGQIPVLCCLSERDLFEYDEVEYEEDSEESVEEVLESLPESVDEVVIKGVKYKKVTKWEKA